MPDSGGDLKFILSVDTAQGLTSLKQFGTALDGVGDSGSRAGGRVVNGLSQMQGAAQNVKGPVSEIQALLDRMQADKAEVAIQKLQKQLNITHDVATRLHAAMSSDDDPFKHAHIAAKSLEQELGIELPRAASTFLAESTLIGPMLSAAFSTIAVVGFVEALSRVPEMLVSVRNEISGWGADAQKEYAAILLLNQKAKETAMTLGIGEVASQPNVKNLTGSARATAELGASQQSELLMKAYLKDTGNDYRFLDDFVTTYEKRQHDAIELAKSGNVIGSIVGGASLATDYLGQNKEDYDRRKPERDSLRASRESVQARLDTSMFVDTPEAEARARAERVSEASQFRQTQITGFLGNANADTELLRARRIAGLPDTEPGIGSNFIGSFTGIGGREAINRNASSMNGAANGIGSGQAFATAAEATQIQRDKLQIDRADADKTNEDAKKTFKDRSDDAKTRLGTDNAAAKNALAAIDAERTAAATKYHALVTGFDDQERTIAIEDALAVDVIKRNTAMHTSAQNLAASSIEISGAQKVADARISLESSVAKNRSKLADAGVSTELMTFRGLSDFKLSSALRDIQIEQAAMEESYAALKAANDANTIAQTAALLDAYAVRNQAAIDSATNAIDTIAAAQHAADIKHQEDQTNLQLSGDIVRANATTSIRGHAQSLMNSSLGSALGSSLESLMSDLKSPHPNIYSGTQINYSDAYSSRTGQLDPVKMELAMKAATQNGWGDFYLRGTSTMSALAAFSRHLFVDLGMSIAKAAEGSLSTFVTKEAFAGLKALIPGESLLGGMLGLGTGGKDALPVAMTGLTAAVNANTVALGGSPGGIGGSGSGGLGGLLGKLTGKDPGGLPGENGGDGTDLGTDLGGLPGVDGGAGTDLGFGGGAGGLLGLGSMAMPLIGGIAAGIFGLFELFKHPVQVAMTPDPFAEIKALTVFFNTTMPFEKLTTTLGQVQQALSDASTTNAALADGVASFSTMSPGQLMINGAPAAKAAITGAVIDHISSNRTARRALAGPVLEQAI